MELIVEGRGTFIGKHQGRLRVTREQKVITEVPVLHLEQVIVMDSGVAISSDVMYGPTRLRVIVIPRPSRNFCNAR